MRFIILLLTLFSLSYSIEPFTWYWIIKTTGDTATVTKWKNNNDSVLVWADAVCDTLNNTIPRWNWFSNHDSTFSWMNIDTIGGNVVIDSAEIGYLYATGFEIDSLEALALDTLYGQPVVDSITGDLTVTENMQAEAFYMECNDGAKTFGARIIPYEGGTNNPGLRLQVSSDTLDSGIGDLDTLTYSDILRVRNATLMLKDDINFGVTSNYDLMKLYATKIIVDGAIHVEDTLYADSITTGGIGCNHISSTSNIVSSGTVRGAYFTTNGDDNFTYLDTLFNDSLYENGILRGYAQSRAIVTGGSVTIKQSEILGTMNGSGKAYLRGLPPAVEPYVSPNAYLYTNMVIINNSVDEFAILHFQNDTFFVNTSGGSGYFTSGTGGVPSTIFTWVK